MHLSDKGRHYLRVKRWKTILHVNGPQKQTGVAILTSNKINSQTKVIKKKKKKKDKEGHFTPVKRKSYQDELSILNIYAPNAWAPTLIKRNLTKV
jgi:exonuclease III